MYRTIFSLAAAGAVALLLLTACSGPAAAPPEPLSCTEILGSASATPGDPAVGEELFQETLRLTGAPTCQSCHVTWSSEQELVGPGLAGIAATAAARVPGQSAEEYLCRSIVAPNDYIVAGYPDDVLLMPVTYGDVLTSQQVRDLVAYMLTLE